MRSASALVLALAACQAAKADAPKRPKAKAAAKAAPVPARAPSCECLSEEEAALLGDLRARRKQVEEAEASVQDSMARLSALRDAIERRLGVGPAGDAERDRRLARLVEIVGSMKPDAAAAMIGSMPEPQAEALLGALAPDKAASVLAALPPDKAAAVSGRFLALP